MPDYIGVPIETDPDALAEDAYTFLQTEVPGWSPQEGNLETLVIDGMTRQHAEIRELASKVPKDIFRFLGSIIGLPVIQGAKATVNSTWTMINSDGYTIPAGTLVGIRTAGDELITFETFIDTIVPPGSTVTSAGQVPLIAVENGVAFNGLGGAAEAVVLITPLAFVSGAVLVAETSGGADLETTDEYVNRLANRMSIIAPRPINPEDFPVYARIVEGANVGRAVAIDGFNPDNNLLTANQSSAETDASGWLAGANASIASESGQAAHGSKSVRVRSLAAGVWYAQTTPATTPVAPGDTITGYAELKAAVTPRNISVFLRWFTVGDVQISDTYGAAVASSTSAWTARSVTGVAPATAAKVALFVQIDAAAAANEDHYVDKASLRLGASTGAWVLGPVAALSNERYITVFPLHEDGTLLTSGEKTILDDALQEVRELNFINKVDDPTLNTVAVTYNVLALPGFSQADVEDSVEIALESYISPANWGVPPAGTNFGPSTDWLNTTKLYFYEVVQAISAANGVDRILSLTIGLEGGALSTSDVALVGMVPIAQLGTITPTVTLP
jgi:hypothetical protein